ncbi:MAG: hypothetical protein JO303_03165, partial [Caulobacteraceae bacterium]|nr:hypothetical protein [Caulobacteraceae bacterium]
LDRQAGRTISAIVERAGLARAEDFTEVAFEGAAEPGQIVSLQIAGHDGARARGVMGRKRTPFLLEGGRAGDGGDAAHKF